jgi:fructose PTS system EIIBC or EIIC component
MSAPLITPGLVALDADLGAERRDVIRALADRVVGAGRATDTDALFADAWAREQKTDTGVPGGIAIPHCRSTAVTAPTLAMARLKPPVDFGAFDGPADIVFFIAAPEGAGELHLQLLAKLARSLIRDDFTAALRSAESPERIVALVEEATADEPTAAAVPAPSGRPLLVGITSCATGIAHTYMAAEGLENAAKAAGHTMKVETQGSAGSKPLTAAEIAAADAVIFAHDLPVKDAGRFAGKPTVDVGVKKGISDGPALVAQAAALAAEWRADPSKAAAAAVGAPASGALVSKVEEGAGLGTRIRQWLMTGVSYMIPFVAAGGILIALSFMLSQVSLGAEGPIEIVKYNLTSADQYNIAQNFSVTSLTSWAALLFVIGSASFGFLVPILSGFIAFAIADRPGLVPGIVGGSVAATMGAGFLGGLVTGVLGGLVARWVSGWNVAKGVRGVMPVVVIPLLSSFITIGLFITVLGRPIKALTDALNTWLTGMSGASAIILGVILGAMMGFDLGGPVNKVAYAFATTGLAAAGAATDAPQLKIMAAVMAAGMVAPLAMALATTVRPALFSEPERENGKAAWLLGASFIS